MFFILSKVLWKIIAPANFLFFCLLFGVILVIFSKKRFWRGISMFLLIFPLGLITFLMVVPVGEYALRALDNKYDVPAVMPDHVDGIIVLSGVLNQFVAVDRGYHTLNDGAERLTQFMVLANKYPQAKLVFSGGSGTIAGQNFKEADAVKLILRDLNFDTNRVIFERESRNTYENALFSKKLISPKPTETWILITSAFHMPRSFRDFKALGWNIIPYPVDYHTSNSAIVSADFDVLDSLSIMNVVLHEWVGILTYKLTGKIN